MHKELEFENIMAYSHSHLLFLNQLLLIALKRVFFHKRHNFLVYFPSFSSKSYPDDVAVIIALISGVVKLFGLFPTGKI